MLGASYVSNYFEREVSRGLSVWSFTCDYTKSERFFFIAAPVLTNLPMFWSELFVVKEKKDGNVNSGR